MGLCAALLAASLGTLPGGPVGAQGVAGVDLAPPRIAGDDRVATGEALVGRWVAAGGQTSTVVVVSAADTAVALASASLAGIVGGVTVLSDAPPRPSTVEVVRATGAQSVVVVGGDLALVEGWVATGLSVDHLTAEGGAPAVAAALARRVLDGTDGAVAGADSASGAGGEVVLAGTGGLPDALAVGPTAYRDRRPILLTAAEALDPHTRFVIEQRGVDHVTVVGGTAVVGDAVVAELAAMDVVVQRVAGPDREQTALAIAAGAVAALPGARPSAALGDTAPGDTAPGNTGDTAAGAPPDPVAVGAALAPGLLLAAGDDPADAASAAAYAVRTGRPILPPGAQVQAALAGACGRVGALTVLGGGGAISVSTEDAHRAAAQRCDGLRAAMTVRVAVATPGAPGQEAAVLAGVTGPQGWGSRRVRLASVGDAAHLGVIVADPGACGGVAALCRVDSTFLLDGAAWGSADPTGRQRLLDLAVGSWLGVAIPAGCEGGVMDPPGCASGQGVDDAARDAAADRFVPSARLSFAGDVHGERHIATAVAEGRNPLAHVAEHLAGADLAVLNLETPLSGRGSPADKTFVFRGPPAMAADLAEAGVDIVSLANNHALDYGVDALADTLDHLAAAGVGAVGAGGDATAAYAPVVTDTPAGRVAVVGLTRVLHTRAWEAGPDRAGLASAYDEDAAVAAVTAAREVADHVVVAIHWGTERADCPDGGQRHLAGLLRDAGADVIVGHHPHVLQGVQVRDGGLIAYSLGNFVWYHNSAPSRFTGILDVELPLLDDPRWTFTPAEIGMDGAPRLADGSLGAAISGRLLDRSPGGALGCGFP